MIESHINAIATEGSGVDSVDSYTASCHSFLSGLSSSVLQTTTSSSSNASGSGSTEPGSRKTSISMFVPKLPKWPTSQTIVPDHHCQLCFQAKRHQEVIEGSLIERQFWRIRERMKTASVALVLCLNIGVDPPDVVKIQPCARLECWIDPSSVSAPKAMELIGANLQMQYERWQPRARYKKCHDPTFDDVKKLCTSLRRNAKGERILFHYNGHGVPKPTANGEIWVFNKTFTQYIPLSIFELQSWMAAPSIYVYDCSNAGIIINSFQQFAEQHERDLEKALASTNQRSSSAQQSPPMISYKNCIHLAACSANQILPMNAALPADLFTSCLTTPIIIALKWYTMQVKFDLVPQIQSDLIEKIPGKVNDRRTMLGELNWIFTAITDTIAWNTLPRELFQRLFRQDLLVASLFRNFLLAERILRSHDCTPVSHPALPPCFRHPMWSAWDLVVDLALQQLPEILEKGATYRQLPFFEEQLTAFQVWLDRESESRSPPEQLPIVLQVLLSQVHRLRALELLARFLDLGPWAVNLALGVGIFPYVLKLLQSSAKELRPVLVFIWAKILAVDPTCQVDLVKDHKYFLAVLQDSSVSKEHRTLSAFVLASIVNNFLLGQTSALQGSLVSICLEQLNDESWLLRQWLAICLGMLWQHFEKARWSGVRDLAHEKLYALLKDAIPEVRAAAVFALGTFISSVTDRSEEHANNIDRIVAMTLLETVGEDMSPLVRLELASALQWMVLLFESQFVTVYMQDHSATAAGATAAATVVSGERSASISHGMPLCPGQTMHNSTHSLERHVTTMRRGVSSSSISNMATSSIPFQSIFLKLWQGIYNLGHDPFPKVAETAQKIIAYVHEVALNSITAKEETTTGVEKNMSLSVSLPPSPNTRVNYLGSEASSPVTGGVQTTAQPNTSSWATKLRSNAQLMGNVLAAANEPQALLQRKLRTTSMNDETDGRESLALSGGASTAAATAGAGGDGSLSARSSTSDNYEHKAHSLKPIVMTPLIPWAISYFTRPGKNRYSSMADNQQALPVDRNAPELRAREYRYQRNQHVRTQASREQCDRVARIDTQICLRKTQSPPAIVKLVPFESQIAVAYKERVALFDWTRDSVRSYTPVSINSGLWSQAGYFTTPLAHVMHQRATARVSAIEFLNAQDIGLVMVGHADGVLRVWQHTDDRREARLITAWEGLPSAHTSPYTSSFGSAAPPPGAAKHSTRKEGTPGGSSGWDTLPSLHATAAAATHLPTYASSSLAKQRRDASSGGIVTAWQQYSQQLVVAGRAHRFLRIWDVERELKISDISTGNEATVRVLSPFPSNVRSDLIVAGCNDGGVRLFDKRCSSAEARICVYREHSAPILAACLQDNQTSLVSGCGAGKLCVHDLRASGATGPLQQWETGADVTAIAAHQTADMVACGSTQKITIYNQSGVAQSTLRSNEGFMSSKACKPTCLSFHPYRASLAVGFVEFDMFYKLCKRWNIDVDKNPMTFDNARQFLQGPEMRAAVDFIRQKTQIDDITPELAQLIYTVCAFETAWNRHQSAASVWCSLFNRSTIKALEFAEDLDYFWNDGYGHELTHQIACPAIVDMFDHIDPDSRRPNATVYFTHSGTLLKLLAHLGLYKDSWPLTHNDFQRQRSWRTSAIDAFATNLVFVLYNCVVGGPMVLTMHQERPVRLPGCPLDSELCSLSTLRLIFNSSLTNCDFHGICQK